MTEKACKRCRLIVTGDVCPNCQEASELTKTWTGYIFIFSPEGDVAKAIGAKAPGKYALKIK